MKYIFCLRSAISRFFSVARIALQVMASGLPLRVDVKNLGSLVDAVAELMRGGHRVPPTRERFWQPATEKIHDKYMTNTAEGVKAS